MENQDLYTNTVEGFVGGASSVIPVVVVSGILFKISEYVNKGNQRDMAMIGYTIISLGLGLAAGITGGALADNYSDSAYNGVNYGVVTSFLVSLASLLTIKYS
jgi:predicted cation transporter